MSSSTHLQFKGRSQIVLDLLTARVWLAFAMQRPADAALQQKYLCWQWVCKRGAGWPNICERVGGQSPGDQTYLGEMWFLQHWPDDRTHFGRGQKMTVRGRLSCPGSICIMPDDLQRPTITFKCFTSPESLFLFVLMIELEDQLSNYH